MTTACHDLSRRHVQRGLTRCGTGEPKFLRRTERRNSSAARDTNSPHRSDFPRRRLIARASLVAVLAWHLEHWWAAVPHPPLRCLVIPKASRQGRIGVSLAVTALTLANSFRGRRLRGVPRADI